MDKYEQELNKFKFSTEKIVNTQGHVYYYTPYIEANKLSKVNYQNRLIKEITSLQQSLPVNYGASIFLRMDPENMSVMRILMTGPEGTPYDSGCYIFDVCIPNNFPQVPPNVQFMNHSGKRFNPNLYENGKLCLSLLGTFTGDNGGESWNSKTSTIYQVFISIQSLILNSQPYFNQPSCAKLINTSEYNKENEKYNNNIRMYTLCHAIRDMITNLDTYPQFKDVIVKHFILKKKYILELCEKWTNDAKENLTYKKEDFEKVTNEIKILLDKLN